MGWCAMVGVLCGWCVMGWCVVVVPWVVLWVEASGMCFGLRPMGGAVGGAMGLWWLYVGLWWLGW